MCRYDNVEATESEIGHTKGNMGWGLSSVVWDVEVVTYTKHMAENLKDYQVH